MIKCDPKRLLDILISSEALIILAPLLIVVMVILKFTGEGEIFFLQPRVGQNGKLFHLFKFATMLKVPLLVIVFPGIERYTQIFKAVPQKPPQILERYGL
jgi:lipopolysaccharide/colanic/teichoic acid biosynthesis glycosyltransferase